MFNWIYKKAIIWAVTNGNPDSLFYKKLRKSLKRNSKSLVRILLLEEMIKNQNKQTVINIKDLIKQIKNKKINP